LIRERDKVPLSFFLLGKWSELLAADHSSITIHSSLAALTRRHLPIGRERLPVQLEIAARAELDPTEWHLHRFRDTAATRWLRAGIDVRTVQEWLGHESLATTQKYLEPSKETEKQLEAMKLPL
jgi:site-specific recombinase XerD